MKRRIGRKRHGVRIGREKEERERRRRRGRERVGRLG